MAPSATRFVNLALSQDGDQYVFGHEVSPSDSDPNIFDCSELIEWACSRLGVFPRMPDGSWFQARHARNHGTLITVQEGIDTPGALLFKFGGDPFTGGRPRTAHVAISQGDGTTIEARSARYGVGQFSAQGRGWTHAALIPGLDYQTHHRPTITELEMTTEQIVKHITVDQIRQMKTLGLFDEGIDGYWERKLTNPADPEWEGFLVAIDINSKILAARPQTASTGGIVTLAGSVTGTLKTT
jgi:cell wall-associated NlpC family hydrolase